MSSWADIAGMSYLQDRAAADTAKMKADIERRKANPHPNSIAARLAARRAAKAPAADWYADPEGGPFWRWWDGAQWTHHTYPS